MTHGQVAFTTTEMGTYSACLAMHHDQTHHTLNNSFIVSLDWKMGIRTKDWGSVAKKEKIEASLSFLIYLGLQYSQEIHVIIYNIVLGCGASASKIYRSSGWY